MPDFQDFFKINEFKTHWKTKIFKMVPLAFSFCRQKWPKIQPNFPFASNKIKQLGFFWPQES